MAMQSFTDNFQDNSTEAGFQFTFFCDLCQEGYKTKFIESKSYKKGRLFKNIGSIVSTVSSLTGKHNVGYNVRRSANVLSERFHGMSPDWHKEHEAAFASAQNEARGRFQRCPKCRKWLCANDWNEQEGLCVECAPRANVEIASAKAQRMAEEIKEEASKTRVFQGKIESKQTLCPQCGKPAGEGKFCSNCGASLQMVECERCGAQNSHEARFCGECGNKLM